MDHVHWALPHRSCRLLSLAHQPPDAIRLSSGRRLHPLSRRADSVRIPIGRRHAPLTLKPPVLIGLFLFGAVMHAMSDLFMGPWAGMAMGVMLAILIFSFMQEGNGLSSERQRLLEVKSLST